ncbi:MAG: glycosyltransferase family 2 protein, partial [bacterium]
TGEHATLLFVDNGSTDDTREKLGDLARSLEAEVLRNSENRGVAAAWNQGVRWAKENGADWIGILNNDLVLSPDWLPDLLERARTRAWNLACPATREGELNYGFEPYTKAYVRRCKAWDAPGLWFGWCFVVEARVFDVVGTFDEGFQYGGCEDTDFMKRFAAAGFSSGVSGCSFVHHFGSRTQRALKLKIGDAFGHANIARLKDRYGAASARSPLAKLASATCHLAELVRWGHHLKE